MSTSQEGTTTYDIIFAGGGTAACVCAGRLAAADPSLRILLLEAGPHTLDLPEHVQPARYFYNLMNSTTTLSFQVGKESKALNGRKPIIPVGNCVGGGSSVNFQMYTRASASDYDDWERFGNPGWGSKDLIPLSNKAESYQVDESPKHGHSGPIKISSGGGFPTNISVDYLQVAAAYDKNRVMLEDVADFGDCNGYGRWHKYIDKETGKRSDTAHHYIYNQLPHNKNLTVKDKCRVSKVIFEETRAVGVEFFQELKNKSTNGDSNTTPPGVNGSTVNGHNGNTSNISAFKALATKMVVLSAGAFGSPAILERSGIGSSELLNKLRIPLLVDLPGVGENYNDHNVCFVPFYATEDAHTMDDIFGGDSERIEPYLTQWQKNGQGLMAHNGLDVGVKLRPVTQGDFDALGEEFQDTWKNFYEKAPDKALMWSGMINVGKTYERRFISSCYFTYYPVSIGYVHISSSDPFAAPDFDPAYLNHPADLAVLRWGYKHSREIIRRMSFSRGGVPAFHPKFPEGSEACVGEQDKEDAIDVADIKYTKEDDLAIDEFHREILNTAWHSLGTCAMKPRSQNGVVDSKLNVYGVEGLKVVDLSVAPSNVGANTYNTALVIGEKAALIIAGELGIKGV
ncbi:hypothetical protein VKT23_019260 [Stygiomarasmius scandens]|uniref:Glucose-methanol-choline oxidoreductase N-terminal domain-containing protein n=1 Tax=Marasmiellus scandens TaxID=2682957 RepID=A0ABR1IR26_9AGAR